MSEPGPSTPAQKGSASSLTRQDSSLTPSARRFGKEFQEERRLQGSSLSDVAVQRMQSQEELESAWTRMQTKAFTVWLNSHLKKRHMQVDDIGTELQNGLVLLNLVEILKEYKFTAFEKRPRMRIHMIQNLGIAMRFMKQDGVKLLNIGPEDVCDGNLKLILGLMWALIVHYEISEIAEEDALSKKQLSAKEALLRWCQRCTADYSNVGVKNFTSSWQDGLAFCALIHHHRSDLIDYAPLHKDHPIRNLDLAFDVADLSLGIPKMLDSNDMVSVKPDERSVMTYVSMYHKVFSQMNKNQRHVNRINRIIDMNKHARGGRTDYMERAQKLQDWLNKHGTEFEAQVLGNTIPELESKVADLKNYKRAKGTMAAEKEYIKGALKNLNHQLSVNGQPEFVPPEGLRPEDLEASWARVVKSERTYEQVLLTELARLRELENKFQEFLRRVKQLQDWMDKKKKRLDELVVGETLSAIDDNLHAHDVFEDELGKHEKQRISVEELAEELKAAHYGDEHLIQQKQEQAGTQWGEIAQATLDHRKRLEEARDRWASLRTTCLQFTKLALDLQRRLEHSDNALVSPYYRKNLDRLGQLLADLEAHAGDLDSLNELAAVLISAGVPQDTFADVSAADINSQWAEVMERLEAAKDDLALEEEKERGIDALLEDFSLAAKEFNEWCAVQREEILSPNEGPLEVQLSVLQSKAPDVHTGKEKVDTLAKSWEEIESTGTDKVPSHTLDNIVKIYENLEAVLKQRLNYIENEVMVGKFKVSQGQIQEWRDTFDFVDKDKSGKIDIDEFDSSLKALGTELAENELDAAFKAIDLDGSGEIDFDEYCNYMISQTVGTDFQKDVGESFATLAGGKEYVTEDDLRKNLGDQQVAYLLANMPAYPDVEGAYDYKTFIQQTFEG